MEKTKEELWTIAVKIFLAGQLKVSEGVEAGIERIATTLVELGYETVKKES